MSLRSEFKLKIPLPKYRSTEALVKNLIDYITTGGFEVGSKFLYDRDLVLITGRSRTTVRRALDILQEEGWITRRGGKGTFVGERLADYRAMKQSENESGQEYVKSTPFLSKPDTLSLFSKTADKSTLRVAVAVSGLVSVTSKTSWFYSDVLDGIDQVASQENIVIEFLGYHGTQIQNLNQRLESSRPDIFLCIGPPLNHVNLIKTASRWDIPCALAAIRAPELGIPNFYEDSVTAAKDAVKYLHDNGHKRIGFAQVMSSSGWWAFDRYDGYLQGLRECEIDKNVGEGLWLPMLPTRESLIMLKRYIKRNKLTALISGSFWAMGHVAELIRKQEIKIPDDISCMTFDRNPVVKYLLGGMAPTTINLPWLEIAEAFVKNVRPIINGGNIPLNHMFPCQMTEGETVIPYQGD